MGGCSVTFPRSGIGGAAVMIRGEIDSEDVSSGSSIRHESVAGFCLLCGRFSRRLCRCLWSWSRWFPKMSMGIELVSMDCFQGVAAVLGVSIPGLSLGFDV